MTGGLAYLMRVKHLKPTKTRLNRADFNKRRIGGHGVGAFMAHHPQAYLICGLVIVSIIASPWLSKYRFLFQASLIDLPAIEFTGTTYPVKKVPIWTDLTEAERKYNYNQIQHKLGDLPAYNLQALKNGQDWNGNNHHEINTYVTYPVPNLGNYELDGTEDSGSHPGIDIKLPIGTPIHSIANGIVYKVGNLTTGFGKSVSIAHVGIPDPKNPNKKTTLVSTYAHLSKTVVREGDKITKGQVIGDSGDTGFATAPHLHFQIDRMDAPFIPYWPFSWKEVQAAGFSSYFDGVKFGLGKEKAEKYTVHPFNLISQFQDFQSEPLLIAFDDSQTPVPVVTEFTAPEPVKTSAEKPVTPESRQSFKRGQLELEFETDRSYTPGQKEVVKIHINEANLVASSGILLSSTLKERAQVEPPKLSADDFINGTAEVTVKTSSQYPFKLVAKSDFGEIKSQSLKPAIFADIPGDHLFANAISFLKENGVVKGYADNTYRPDQTLNRAEALKIILESNRIKAIPEQAPFSDIEPNQWFYNYVTTAFKKSIVKGYPDGSFKPGNTVNRAEFVKMAIATAGFDPNPELSSDPYSDVPKDAWFAKYFQFSKDQNLIRDGRPNDLTTRGEAADIIFKLSKVRGR